MFSCCNDQRGETENCLCSTQLSYYYLVDEDVFSPLPFFALFWNVYLRHIFKKAKLS